MLIAAGALLVASAGIELPADRATAAWTPQLTSVQSGSQKHVYYPASNGTLEHRWNDGAIWRHEYIGGASIEGKPAATSQNDVYARSTAGYLQHWWFDAGASAWSHEQLGHAPIAGSPTVAEIHDEEQHVWARGTNGRLQHWWWTSGTGWGHQDMGGPSISGTPSAAGTDVYARSTSGYLLHWWWDGSGWPREQLSQAPIADSPNVAALASGDHQVWARGTNGRLQLWWWRSWERWYHLEMDGPAIQGMPAGTPHGDVYATGANGYLQHWWVDRDSWEREELREFVAAPSPSALVYDYGGWDHSVFFFQTNGTLTLMVWDDGWTWQTF